MERLLEDASSKGGELSEIATTDKMTDACVLKRVKENADLSAALDETKKKLVDLVQPQWVAAV